MHDIQALIDQNRQKVGNSIFISIDGHGGSGKSTLAKLLSSCLGAGIVQTDDFASPENPRNWWPKVLESVFLPIESGATGLSYKKSDWWVNQKSEYLLDQNVSDVMIIEGVGSSQVRFRKYLGLSIFVDTPVSICMERGIARDLSLGFLSEDDVSRNWKQWIQEELMYFKCDKPEQYAEIMIKGVIPFNHQIVGLN